MLKYVWLWLHCNVSICIGWHTISSEFFSLCGFQLVLAIGNTLHETQGIELKLLPYISIGFPGYSMGKSLPAKQETQGSTPRFNHQDREIPQRKEWQPTPVFLLKSLADRGAWPATVHGITESCTQLKWLSTYIHLYVSVHLPVCLSVYPSTKDPYKTPGSIVVPAHRGLFAPWNTTQTHCFKETA